MPQVAVDRCNMHRSRRARWPRAYSLALIMLCGLSSCGGPRTGGVRPEMTAVRDDRVIGEAMAFDARLRRDGKPNTFQLEVYLLDGLMGFSGKGYLGKGGLRGVLTADSLHVSFPTSNEYLREPLDCLFEASTCPAPIADLDILELFRCRPDALEIPESVTIDTDTSDANRPRFGLASRECGWTLRLVYDRQESGWRVREFQFDDGDVTSLKGSRTRYKARADIRVRRFQVSPSPDASRIRP